MKIDGISPFAKTDELWFDSKKESENTEYEIYKASKEYFSKTNKDTQTVYFGTDTPEGYYKAKLNVRNSLNGIKVSFPDDYENDMSNYYPENPKGSLKIKCGANDEEFMKPVIL